MQFDSGLEMSTSRFFTAKGLRWPVGGNLGKLRYLASALEQGTAIEVVPEKVTVEKDREIKNGPRAGQTFDLITYYFQSQKLPEVNITAGEEA